MMAIVIMGVFVLLVTSSRARHAVADKAAKTVHKNRGGLLLLAIVLIIIGLGSIHLG